MYKYILFLTDEGKNIFEVKYVSKKILVAHTHSEDNDGQTTELAGEFNKGDIFISTVTLLSIKSVGGDADFAVYGT